jgi:hypothetical protein
LGRDGAGETDVLRKEEGREAVTVSESQDLNWDKLEISRLRRELGAARDKIAELTDIVKVGEHELEVSRSLVVCVLEQRGALVSELIRWKGFARKLEGCVTDQVMPWEEEGIARSAYYSKLNGR